MIGAHIFLVPDVVLLFLMRTPSQWPAVRTERSHSFVPTECDSAYYYASARRPQRGLSKVMYLSAVLRLLSILVIFAPTCTEFYRRRQAMMCINVIENINWQEGGAASLNIRDGDEKR